MASTTTTTTLSDLFDPEVVGDEINKKLVDAIRLSPLAKIETSLVGNAGDTVKLPSYAYIGDAENVDEGADIPTAKLTQTTESVTIYKIGKGVEITDEALLSGYGTSRIMDEATNQIVTAIGSKVEDDLIAAMSDTAELTATATGDNGAEIVLNALAEFEEDLDGEKVIAVPPSFYLGLVNSTYWIPNTEIGADIIIKGAVGMIHGCQIIMMNRLTASNEAYIIKPGALAIITKRDTLVEFDRDYSAQINYVFGSKLFAPYVYDKTKLIKLSLTTA